LRRAIGAAMLGPRLREQVALAVAEAQQCQYGVCSHTEAARQLGLTEEEIALSREARSRDQRMRAALRFARDLVAHSDVSLAELRQAGYEDSAILELIAIIAFERFANDVALIAQTTIDGPLTARAVSAA
jgi:AhpD family alkylhydroperoxidase